MKFTLVIHLYIFIFKYGVYNFSLSVDRMATGNMTFDQASELLLNWYYKMRVEFLTSDELDFELKSRSVVFDPKSDLSRKRKWLRDKLTHEQLTGSGSFAGIIDSDAKDEAQICIQKYADMKQALSKVSDDEGKRVYSNRLLHVGARIAVVLSSSKDSPNLHSHLQILWWSWWRF